MGPALSARPALESPARPWAATLTALTLARGKRLEIIRDVRLVRFAFKDDHNLFKRGSLLHVPGQTLHGEKQKQVKNEIKE